MKIRSLPLAMAIFMAAPQVAPAETYSLGEIVSVELMEGWRRADGLHMSGLSIRLAPGWKTYWRSPGDGGIPLALDLSTEPEEVFWPRPQVFYTGTMRSIGYDSDVILPLSFDLGTGAQTVSGTVSLGICQDVCIPVRLDIDATLPDGNRPDPRIVAALSDRPLQAESYGATAAICSLRPIADGLRIELEIEMPDAGGPEEVVIELPDPMIWISDPESSRQGSVLSASADIVPADAGPFALDRSELRITVLGAYATVEILGDRKSVV